jgi:hypothetical protein
MDVNYFGAVRLTNFLVKYMMQENEKLKTNPVYRPEYFIVNIGSVQSLLSIPYRSACKSTTIPFQFTLTSYDIISYQTF